MENDIVEKTLKNSYDFAKNKAEAKTYYQTNKEKIQKRLREYYRNIPEEKKI